MSFLPFWVDLLSGALVSFASIFISMVSVLQLYRQIRDVLFSMLRVKPRISFGRFSNRVRLPFNNVGWSLRHDKKRRYMFRVLLLFASCRFTAFSLWVFGIGSHGFAFRGGGGMKAAAGFLLCHGIGVLQPSLPLKSGQNSIP